MSGWLRWFFGAALVGAVVAAAVHFTEGREFVRLVEEAQPIWLLMAVILAFVPSLGAGLAAA